MNIEAAEIIVRKLRQKMFGYSEVKQDQALRIIGKLKTKINRQPYRRDYPPRLIDWKKLLTL